MGQALIAPFNPVAGVQLFEEWLSSAAAGTLGWTSSSSGAGAANAINVALAEQFHPGLVQMSTGTTATGRSAIQLGATGSMVLTNGVIQMQTSINLPSLSTVGVEEFRARWGLGDSVSADFANGAYFEYDASVSANWRCKTAATSVRTVVDSGVAVAANTFIRLAIIVTNGGTAQFYINEVLVATISTTLPNSFTGVAPLFHIVKSVGTTARLFVADYFYFKQRFTGMR